MGLEMYLYKVKRIEGFHAMDYAYAHRSLDYKKWKEVCKKERIKFTDTLTDWGIPESMTLEKAQVLESEYKDKSPVAQFKSFSLFDEVGCWEKANHIHAWFVMNVQGAIDDCSYYFVTEDNFLELKETCEKVLALNPFSTDVDVSKRTDLFYVSILSLVESGAITKDDYEEMKAKLEEIMPTQSGFFFGETDYNAGYFQLVKNTLEIVYKILENGDFDKEVYLYHSSW